MTSNASWLTNWLTYIRMYVYILTYAALLRVLRPLKWAGLILFIIPIWIWGYGPSMHQNLVTWNFHYVITILPHACTCTAVSDNRYVIRRQKNYCYPSWLRPITCSVEANKSCTYYIGYKKRLHGVCYVCSKRIAPV